MVIFFSVHALPAAVHWSPPEILFSSTEYTVEAPYIFFDEMPNQLELVWLVSKEGQSSLLSSHFNGTTWLRPTTLYTTAATISSLSFGRGCEETNVLCWISSESVLAAKYRRGIWCNTITLPNGLENQQNTHLSTAVSKTGNPLIAWQDKNCQLQGVTLNQETPSPVYHLNKNGQKVVSSLMGPNIAIYNTEDGVFSVDPLSYPSLIQHAQLFPLPATPFCLSIDGSIFLFEDHRSHYLIGGHWKEGKWFYQIIDPVSRNRMNACVTTGANQENIASIWQTTTGMIYTSLWDGASWTIPKMQYHKGTCPRILILSYNQHVLAAWISCDPNLKEAVVMVSEWSFPQWTSPICLSPPGEEISDLQISANELGDVVAVWTRQIKETHHAMVEVARGVLF
ncbi:MAG: hypothetical protein A3D96_06395 [Chlamydiae bacterium RIFCSPHIGHO2_12_FULL_44_59]|nr:MAG: hypothetical protein A3D96_06395 [Chlamydiae bacterium RIFCSPHIGHO2_12_FULL_44_59]OGN69373.1 MAG: hypothetical protein A3F79_06605 [Chlamydiae bacterium RIFCSPLOWO2_12_FULL_45_20]